MVITSIADITGDNAVHTIGAAGQQARAIFLCAHGSSNARFGDANVGAARGTQLTADVTVPIRASEADRTDYISLTQACVYVPTGTSVSIATGL